MKKYLMLLASERDAIETAKAEGEVIGMEKKALETAKNLKEMGALPDFISKATGLSVQEVENIPKGHLKKGTRGFQKPVTVGISTYFCSLAH